MGTELQIVEDSFAVVADRFKHQPFDFLYESDIRSLLFAELFARSPESQFVDKVSRGNRFMRWNNVLTINPVKSEYPSGSRFDLAVLDINDDARRALWAKPVRIAVEVKLWQIDGTGGSVKEDLRKLLLYRQSQCQGREFTGLAVVFCHPNPRTPWSEWLEEFVPRLAQEPVFPEDGFALHVVDEVSWRSAEVSTPEIEHVL